MLLHYFRTEVPAEAVGRVRRLYLVPAEVPNHLRAVVVCTPLGLYPEVV